MKYLEVYETIPENLGGCLTEKIQITLKFYWLEKNPKTPRIRRDHSETFQNHI